MTKSLYLIDGYYQVYRAYYALRQPLNSPVTGEPTAAIHGFFMMLFGLIRDREPTHLAVLMDVSDETVFRCDIDPNYKANRDAAPEDLHTQVDRIVSIVSALGIPLLRLPGFEADDLMATFSEQLRDEDVTVYLVSRDKDLEQLLTPRVHMYDPTKNAVIDTDVLKTTKGYTPAEAVEVQTLVGDATDNVPGVHGVGPKTAVKLIAKYGSAAAVLDHADQQTPKLAQNLRAFADQIATTRQLVTLRRDAPITLDLDNCSLKHLQAERARPIFAELGLTTLRDRLETLTGASSGAVDTDSVATPVTVERGAYQLVDTDAKLAALAAKLNQQPAFAFDTETSALNAVRADLVGLSFSFEEGSACYVPVRAAMGDVVSVSAVVEALAPVFSNPRIAKIGHNIKYDMLVLRQVGIEVQNVAFDTMLASFLLVPTRRSHSLDALTQSLIGHEMIPITDLIGKGKNQISLDQLDTARVGEYAAEDADFTWRLYRILEPQLIGSDVEPLFYDTEMPLVNVLMEMEHNGIALDSPLLVQLGEAMAKRTAELTTDIHHIAGHPFNIDSTKQLAVVLFDEQGFTPVKKTKTGHSTDADTLQTLTTQQDNPIPTLVLEYRELAKLKGTYVETLPRMVCERTGRIHASFNQTGAITGRLSSSDPNLQNIPIRTETGRRIREAIVAGDDDHVLLTADYSQIELRLLAHFCQDPALLDAFRRGEDIHRTVAARVNGISPDEVTPAQRGAAKAVNFGIIYGQSPFGLARSLGIGISQAKTFIDTYFMQYPGIRLFIDQCVADAKKMGYARTILGRKRPVPELQSRNRGQVSAGERIAVNTVVQGSAADLIKRAMIEIHQELRTGSYDARMVVQVHDELVFEVGCDDVDRTAALVKDKMESAIALNVPIVVDVAWGRSWADTK